MKNMLNGLDDRTLDKHRENMLREYKELCMKHPLFAQVEQLLQKNPKIGRELILMEHVINLSMEIEKLRLDLQALERVTRGPEVSN